MKCSAEAAPAFGDPAAVWTVLCRRAATGGRAGGDGRVAITCPSHEAHSQAGGASAARVGNS